jgi:hypothetical protein
MAAATEGLELVLSSSTVRWASGMCSKMFMACIPGEDKGEWQDALS